MNTQHGTHPSQHQPHPDAQQTAGAQYGKTRKMPQEPQAQPQKYGMLRRSWFYWAYLALVGLIIFVLVIPLNINPWLQVGGWLAGEIQDSQFFTGVSWLLRIVPFVGRFFAATLEILTGNLTLILAAILWAIVQLCQILAVCTATPVVARWVEMVFGFRVPKDPDTVKKIKWLSGFGYALELFVCLLRYPIYGVGMSDLGADFGVWDWYLINWDQALLGAMTMFFMEIFIGLIAFLTVSVFMMGRKAA
jgi:hypothetical protein